MNNLFPAGSSMECNGAILPANDKERIIKELEAKVESIIRDYGDNQIVELSEKVQEMRSQFTALGAQESQFLVKLITFFDERISAIEAAVNDYDAKTLFEALLEALSHEKGSDRYFRVKAAQIRCLFAAPEQIVVLSKKVRKFSERYCAQGLNGETNSTLFGFFENRVRAVEGQAQTYVQKGHFVKAAKCYTTLLAALEHEMGTDRYFHIQASSLAVVVTKGDIAESVSRLLELEKQGVPRVFQDWCGRIRAHLVQIVRDKLDAIEHRYLGVQTTINGAAATIGKTLSQASLQAKLPLNEYLRQLKPVQQNLQACEAQLEKCDSEHATFAAFCSADKLNFVVETHKDNVRRLFVQWNTLNNSAIELLTALNDAQSDEEKNETLRGWITKEIGCYDCPADKLSALHGWALSLLGKLYFSKELSQEALDATVTLVRQNARRLFTHFRAFPCDVQLSFGNHHIDMSLLVLATISERLKGDYCTAEKIRDMLTWSLGGLYKAIMRQAQEGLPKISLDLPIQANLVHIKNLDLILNELLSAFQKNKYDFKLPPQDVVALFEIANYLLEMPSEIAELSINHLHDTDLEKQLDALLWLRLSQARILTIPYAELEDTLPSLNHAGFLEWVRLYNPVRLVSVPENHQRLFYAIALAGTPHVVDKNKFTENEVMEIFSFVTTLYGTLVSSTEKDKEKLHSHLILFGCQVASRLTNFNGINANPALATLQCLDTTVFRKGLSEPVRRWLETTIYPRLVALNLHEGLHSNGFGNFAFCKRAHTLVMPLTAENSQNDVKDLPRCFPDLTRLSLRDGPLNPAQLAAIPLAWLSLANIENCLDFTVCKHQQTLEALSLINVEVQTGSLAWLGECEKLQELTIHAKRGTLVGCVANNKRIHGHPTLKSVSVTVDDLDGDKGLLESLSKLIESHRSINSVTLIGGSESSLLPYVLACAPSIKSLTIKMALNEDLQVWTKFRHLETLTLIANSEEQAQYIMQTFKGYKFNWSGMNQVTIQLKDKA